MLKWLSISALGLLSSRYPSPEACPYWSWRNSSSYPCHLPFRPYLYVLFSQGGQDLSLQPLLCVTSSDAPSGVPPGAGGAVDTWGQVDAVQAQMCPLDGRGLKSLCISPSPSCPCSQPCGKVSALLRRRGIICSTKLLLLSSLCVCPTAGTQEPDLSQPAHLTRAD